MADLICDGPITKQIVEKILCDHFNTPEASLERCQGIVISAGKGFTSDVMRVDLEWSSSSKNLSILPKRVIVKAPKASCIQNVMGKMCMGQEMENSQVVCDSAIQIIHACECNAYKVLSMAEAAPLPVPLIYGFRLSDPGVIVMEDMVERADTLQDIAKGLTLNQWKSIAHCLADLHAWSLTTDVPWRKYISGVETLPSLFKGWVDMTAGLLSLTKEKYPTYFGHVDEELYEKAIDFNRLMRNIEKYRQVLPDVIQHGDTWTNNIMLEKDACGQLTDKVGAFIDWQLCFAGCGLNDLARLSFMCVNHDLRRENELQILKSYYDRFVSKAGQALSPSVTFDRVLKVYLHISANNGLMGVIMSDFLLRFIANADCGETDSRRNEILSRMKAAYDDAAHFLSQADNDTF